MNLNEYQSQIVNIWENKMPPDELLLFCCVGMAEETGECMGKIKRSMRGEGFDREGYLKELGDVLAYLVISHHAYNLLEDLKDSSDLDDLDKKLIKPCNLLKATLMMYQETGYVLEKVESKQYSGFLHYLSDVMYEFRRCLACPEVNSTFAEVMQQNLR